MKGKLQLFEVVVWNVDEDGNRTGVKMELGGDVIATSEAQARRKVNAKIGEKYIDSTEVYIRPFER